MIKGTYVLLLRLDERRHLRVGKLGVFDFPEGHYLYFGSALGGLAARISRHLRQHKRLHWHIDFLTAAATVVEVWWVATNRSLECSWARAGLNLQGVTVPAPGFGASGCRCRAHLVHFPVPRAIVDSVRPKIVGRNVSCITL